MRKRVATCITAFCCAGVMGCTPAKTQDLTMDDLYNALDTVDLEVKDRKPQIARFIKAEVGEAFSINGTRCEVYVWDRSSEEGAWGYDNTKQFGFYGGETVMVKNIGVTCKGNTADGIKVLSIAREL